MTCQAATAKDAISVLRRRAIGVVAIGCRWSATPIRCTRLVDQRRMGLLRTPRP